MPEIAPPDKGFISVDEFAKRTRMDPIKVRRLLKTGFLSGKKISNRQWHIPQRTSFSKSRATVNPRPRLPERSAKPFWMKLSVWKRICQADPSAPGKGQKLFDDPVFLREFWMKKSIWHVKKSEVSKFNKNA